MTRKPSLLLAPALLLGLLTACAGGSGAASTPEPTPEPTPSAPAVSAPATSSAPEDEGLLIIPLFNSFTAEDLEGNEVDQSIFADHDLTMVNIWATFCSPCLNEMPELGELNAEYADQGFQVVGIVMDVLNQDGSFNDAQLDTAREAVDVTGANYTHLLPSRDLIAAKLNQVTGVPETIFVDKDGNQIGNSYLGARPKDGDKGWSVIIDKLLEEVKEGAE